MKQFFVCISNLCQLTKLVYEEYLSSPCRKSLYVSPNLCELHKENVLNKKSAWSPTSNRAIEIKSQGQAQTSTITSHKRIAVGVEFLYERLLTGVEFLYEGLFYCENWSGRHMSLMGEESHFQGQMGLNFNLYIY